MDLDGGVSIVTGSSSGVGAATAELLAGHGSNIVINYAHNASGAKATAEVCEKIGVETLIIKADVSDPAECRKLADGAMDKWGRIDALVNNAGTTKFNPHANLAGIDKDDFLWIYSVNVVGPYMMTQYVAEHMKAGGQGAIVNVASIAAVMGVGSSIAYAASKGALVTMTLSLARILGPEIRVNAVCPGFIQGDWLKEGMGEENYERAIKGLEASTPLGLASTPMQIADTIEYFVCGAPAITGETLIIDAGAHLGGAPITRR